MLQFVYGSQFLHLILSSMISYLIMFIGGPQSMPINFLFVMAYLTGGHIYRMKTDYLGWNLDWTLPYMVVVQKLSALAFNYYGEHEHLHDDFHRLSLRLSKIWKAQPYSLDGVANRSPTEEQKGRSIYTVPSPLEFFSFILFPASVTMGPGFEFTDYRAFADGQIVPPVSALSPERDIWLV